MDNNLWQRRSVSSKLSLTTSNSPSSAAAAKTDSPRTYTPRRAIDSSHVPGKSNPFNNLNSPTTHAPSPTTNASSAFGLGSGAFASFGSSTPKTAKAPGNALDFGAVVGDKKDKDVGKSTEAKDGSRERAKTLSSKAHTSSNSLSGKPTQSLKEHPLKSTWIIWYRPPTFKYSSYEKSTIPLASFHSVETFWAVYTHLKPSSTLPTVSDYHIFKKGIRPVWEDDENKKGGKWIVRLKKGVSDRYWEDLLLAIVGDQFMEAGDEVCGAVLSVRSGEDVLSVWTRIDGGRNIKIRETIKRLLAFPPDTSIVWKSHDDSIAQRTAIDQARQDKGNERGPYVGNRRNTLSMLEEVGPERGGKS